MRACASQARAIATEQLMRSRILATATIASALLAPIAARAQSDTVGIVRDRRVTADAVEVEGIAAEQRPAFREYVIRERVPTFSIPERVVVGGVLPESGVT